MPQPAVLDHGAALLAREQASLLHALAAALDLATPCDLRQWSQGPLQAVLPHRVLACIRLGSDGEPLRLECLHGGVLGAGAVAALSDPVHGLAMAAYRLWRQGDTALPLHGDSHPGQACYPTHPGHCALHGRLAALGLDHALAHGTPMLPGGSTFYLLAGLPHPPGNHHIYLLRLLMPHLHLALQRICVAPRPAPQAARALSPREAQVLRWLREGKSNDEIGSILGISGLTVKNHLQRLYKLLGVSNRAHAVARSDALALR